MSFVLNLLTVLMREPIIEDNASDHALFCKYAAELLERVTGKSLATSTAVPSLSRINKVWTWNWNKLSSHTGEGGDLQQCLYSTVYCSLTFVWTANVRKSLISIIKSMILIWRIYPNLLLCISCLKLYGHCLQAFSVFQRRGVGTSFPCHPLRNWS